ncbi:hypothetical protein RB601_006790 [Gaeumannomyces tritici]
MVKIAIAGASGQLAREIIDEFVATGRHEIIGLLRKDPSNLPSLPGVTWVQTKYDDKAELVRLLAGVNTVICFFVVHTDEGARSQKLLIDAAVEAGVPRYIPSEWSAGASLGRPSSAALMPHYDNKLLVRDYLAALNNNNNNNNNSGTGGGKKVLEYTLLWPGLFLNYLGAPRKTTAHVSTWEFLISMDKGVALAVEGHADARVAFTTIADLRAAVVRIIEHEGEWPVNGGIRGDAMRYADLLELAGRIRGAPLETSWLRKEVLQAGKLEAGWAPKVEHPSLDANFTDEAMEQMSAGIMLAVAAGAWDTSDEWNRLLPDMKFTGIEDFLTPLFKSEQ